ncbi:MAG: hypothetical protein SOI56_03860 [Eubacteriales bacterium]|jgi:glucosamine 6-phosphate synthetase-like amidotransferase/phosphosugar isomerase protein
MTFKELQELVKKKGFGTALYGNVNGEPVYLSRGVREIFLGDDEDAVQNVINAVIAFQGGDYGSAEEKGKKSTPGHEYGRYQLDTFDETDEDTALWVHRDGKAVIVYYRFER